MFSSSHRISRSRQRLEGKRISRNESDRASRSSRGWTRALRRWVMFVLNGPGDSFIIDTLAWFQPGRRCQRKFIELRDIPETFTFRTRRRFVFVGQAPSRTPCILREETESLVSSFARILNFYNPHTHFSKPWGPRTRTLSINDIYEYRSGVLTLHVFRRECG